MKRFQKLPTNVAAVLTFGRPPLVFGAFACALWVMFTHNPLAYLLGMLFLTLAMAFDWIDGWFAERYIPHSRLGPLADRMMDRVVLSIIFPVLGAGMLWRYNRLESLDPTLVSRPELLHALFVLAIGVLVLMRDQIAQFLRSFAVRDAQMVESYELTRLRTLVFSPMAVLIYAYAFYLPAEGWDWLYRGLGWLDQLPLRVWFVLEILFLVINIVSITAYIRKYGMLALDDICEDNELLRRRILSVLPNTITLMNGVLGVTAMIFASYGRVKEALFILIAAAFFDRLDGTVARRLGLTEPLPDQSKRPRIPFGALLDDISDLISFCVAPAVIYYLIFAELAPGHPAAVVALVYFLAGGARLTYFSLDKKPIPGFFKGMPVPAAAMMTMGAIEMAHSISGVYPHYAGAMVIFAASFMLLAAVVMNLYPVRYLHMGRLMGRHPAIMWGTIALWLVGVFTPVFGEIALTITMIYLISPLWTGKIDPSVANVERRMPRPR
ncbi:MAG: CDP-alcohol phosphatidyltransferase family protein [SAR324 cluster bacterium]|nr:CDP-alcohol phosphatidyltransferase family protein [SAR324 cluster bacterium]MCZ6844213.1 CDP-alcohol phosphatidyltransferase family protein [SAR324 cluster bacterium]